MKSLKLISSLALIIAVIFTSCSAEKKLHKRLEGLWNIQSYTENNIRSADAGMANIGTMSFFDNGTGTTNITFNISQNANLSNGTFNWMNSGSSVTITNANTGLSKSWIILKNSKNKQEWQSTDGRGNIQALTLTRVR